MDKRKSTTTAASESTATTAIDNTAVPSRHVHRIIQSFLLVWLDANMDESKENFKNSLARLRYIVASIRTFTNAEECIQFMKTIKEEKIFLIISGSLGQHIVPEIDSWPQLDTIYVFCGNRSVHEQWAKTMSKIRGVYTDIDSICKALEIDSKRCDQAMISMSFRGIDPSFTYTQLFKEVFLEIDYDETTSITELAEYCRLQDDIPEEKIEMIEREYRNHSPIWWYTAPYFIYSMLNRGLRFLDVNIILKLGFFIRHLHRYIGKLYREQQSTTTAKTTPFQVFRGQGLSLQDFEKMKQTKGGFMSFNNFLLTSCDREISLKNFARPAALTPNSVGILFVMTIDPILSATSSTRFVDIRNVSYYKDKEEEILFSTHAIFRIDRIEQVEEKNTDRLWQVNLTLMDNYANDLNMLTTYIREGANWTTGWSRLGEILVEVGEYAKAEQLYRILLEKASSDKDRVDCNFQLGKVYNNMGECSKALPFYEKACHIYEKIGPPNHPDLAYFYNGIGLVYYNMGEYSKALLSHERALGIRQNSLSRNHPDLSTSYHSIGLVYDDMGEYSKALSSHKKALDIRKQSLPENHPDFAASYSNIGSVYSNMGKYSKALSSYKRALEIHQKSFPPNHPNLAVSYNNIGLVYEKMGEHSRALSFHKKAFDILKKSHPDNHPDLAASYSNMGNVYYNMSAYSKALSLYERALDIRQSTLTPNHPDLASSYSNIGSVYSEIGEYSKALEFYEKAHEIFKKSLSLTHPQVVLLKRNIELVKKKL